MNPPRAKKIDKKTFIHNETNIDDYDWLREKTNHEVIQYLNDENVYTDFKTKESQEFAQSLYDEIKSRIKEDEESVPIKRGNYYYYHRNEIGKQYKIYCRKHQSLDVPEEIYLDLNEIAIGKKYLSVSRIKISNNEKYVAYSLDTTGFRDYQLFIKDLCTNQIVEELGFVSSFEWGFTDDILYYVIEDKSKRPYQCYKHTIASDTNDTLMFEENDEMFRISVYKSRNREAFFLRSSSFTTSEVYYMHGNNMFQLIWKRENEHHYFVDYYQDAFWILTNKGAKNFRVVRVSINDVFCIEEIISHNIDILIEDITLFQKFILLTERENGIVYLKIYFYENQQSYRIEFSDSIYEVDLERSTEFTSEIIRYEYQSLIVPPSVYDFDVKSKQQTLLKRIEVIGGYNPDEYTTERIWATSHDGVKIPISLAYKKNIEQNGEATLFLYGYGSYGISLPFTFSFSRLSLLKRNVIYAQAHIRGGNDLGETWHDDGKMLKKKNTFFDFIACAGHLVTEKYTSHSSMMIEGGSAGGLLIGAVLNMNPNICAIAHMAVPFVDVINTMLDDTLPLTVGEYIEWGNPNDETYYRYMKSYCPYSNIELKSYPHLLITTSFNDSQVMYWEPAKYVAKMRRMKTNNTDVLFKINMDAGHSGSSGRFDRIKEVAFEYSVLLSYIGIVK